MPRRSRRHSAIEIDTTNGGNLREMSAEERRQFAEELERILADVTPLTPHAERLALDALQNVPLKSVLRLHERVSNNRRHSAAGLAIIRAKKERRDAVIDQFVAGYKRRRPHATNNEIASNLARKLGRGFGRSSILNRLKITNPPK